VNTLKQLFLVFTLVFGYVSLNSDVEAKPHHSKKKGHEKKAHHKKVKGGKHHKKNKKKQHHSKTADSGDE
jgi:hypothetical protein